MHDPKKVIELAQAVLTTEAQAILNLRKCINDNFIKACHYLLACKGRIIATFASTGSPAFFMHPSEASHGDIGVITKKDVVIVISNSGNTAEILAILPIIKLLNVPLISITSNPKSNLAKLATVNLNIEIKKEACPLGLVPTSSTTATLALGDALAVSLFEAQGFTAKDFARSHPGGTLGKRLLLRVDDLMRTANSIPKVRKDSVIVETLIEMSHKHMGMTTVVNDDGTLAGIFTDGDLRRVLDKKLDIRTTKVATVMTTNCKTIALGMLAFEAIQIMEQHKITSLVITNNKQVIIGVIHLHDLLQSGLI